MTLKVHRMHDGRYGVTPFDMETGDSLSPIFGTRIFGTFELANGYATTEAAKIAAVGDDVAVEVLS